MEKDFEVMQNNMDELLTSLEDTQSDLRKTQVMLIEARMQRLEAEQRLTDALAQIAMMKKAATDAVLTLREYLFMWLTPENQERVKRMLRFYKQSDQTRMMSALLTYLMFGEKKTLPREVERWHMKLICDHIDSDAISLPVHSKMVMLFKKYGLFEKIDAEIETDTGTGTDAETDTGTGTDAETGTDTDQA